MRILDRSWETAVFHDSDPRAYEEFELRSKDVLRGLIARSPTEFVTFKPLLNADQLSDLLSEHRPAKAMWIFRDCFDVVNSLGQFRIRADPGHARGGVPDTATGADQ